MPSVAQINGAAVVDAILAPVAGTSLDPRTSGPRGVLGVETPATLAMRGTRHADGAPAVGIGLYPSLHKGFGGEYRQTVRMPLDPAHRGHATALARIAQLLGRWVECERNARDYIDELRDGRREPVGPHSTTPPHMVSCPLVLRAAMDEAGMSTEDRVSLMEREATTRFDAATIGVDDVDTDDPRLWNWTRTPRRSIRRATIRGDGFVWSQGVNMHYLDVAQRLPETVLNAVVGMPVSRIVDAPWLRRAPGVVILKVGRSPERTRFVLSRAFAHLAGPIPRIGHEAMRTAERDGMQRGEGA